MKKNTFSTFFKISLRNGSWRIQKVVSIVVPSNYLGQMQVVNFRMLLSNVCKHWLNVDHKHGREPSAERSQVSNFRIPNSKTHCRQHNCKIDEGVCNLACDFLLACEQQQNLSSFAGKQQSVDNE